MIVMLGSTVFAGHVRSGWAQPATSAGNSPATKTSATPALPSGWELSGIPALNFNSDEGLGYGFIVHAINYGRLGEQPYGYTVQPQVFFTTKGRRDVSIFFDAPHLLPLHWRVSSYLGREQQLATPYYGLGNDTQYDERNELPPNPHYYRFGRVGVRFNTDFQHTLLGSLRVLVGASTRSWNIDDTPFDSGTTLLARQLHDTTAIIARTISARAGLVYDTRDRETGATKGQWIESLVQYAGSTTLGVTKSFTRVTTTARVYLPLSPRLVWAQRLTAQFTSNTAPFYERFTIQGSFKDVEEGLGGASTIRGLPKNRYAGNGIVFLNEEIRWSAARFSLHKRASAIVLTGFTDIGQVTDNTAAHTGFDGQFRVSVGAGARLRYGENFVVAVDVGHSRLATAPVYIGLGYLF